MTASNGAPAGDDRDVLTTRQGHPVYDNQNQRTIGERGPATLENYQFLEKIGPLRPRAGARARRPRPRRHRVRLLRGVRHVAATSRSPATPARSCSRSAGKRTDVAVRFSTVAGGRDSSEAVRDPRGFAVKFYTEDGNWDLVGNNLGVFFIRDAIKFPDFIHSQKPDPVTFERQVPNRVFDFISQTPESMHMVTLVFSPRGIPASYRTMQGFGVNTYKWVNGDGRDASSSSTTGSRSRASSSWTEDDAAAQQAQGARLPHARTSTRRSTAATTRSGSCASR